MLGLLGLVVGKGGVIYILQIFFIFWLIYVFIQFVMTVQSDLLLFLSVSSRNVANGNELRIDQNLFPSFA